MSSKLPKKALNLKQFMVRQEVLKLYRDIFRTIRQVPDEPTKKELRDWARADFRNNMNHSDEVVIKGLLYSGKKQLKDLRSSLSLSNG